MIFIWYRKRTLNFEQDTHGYEMGYNFFFLNLIKLKEVISLPDVTQRERTSCKNSD